MQVEHHKWNITHCKLRLKIISNFGPLIHNSASDFFYFFLTDKNFLLKLIQMISVHVCDVVTFLRSLRCCHVVAVTVLLPGGFACCMKHAVSFLLFHWHRATGGTYRDKTTLINSSLKVKGTFVQHLETTWSIWCAIGKKNRFSFCRQEGVRLPLCYLKNWQKHWIAFNCECVDSLCASRSSHYRPTTNEINIFTLRRNQLSRWLIAASDVF